MFVGVALICCINIQEEKYKEGVGQTPLRSIMYSSSSLFSIPPRADPPLAAQTGFERGASERILPLILEMSQQGGR